MPSPSKSPRTRASREIFREALQYGHELGTASRLINSAQPRFAAHEIVPDKALRYVALR
jgi:hypothetical protein